MDTFVAMAYRQLKKFVRAKARMLSMLTTPILWIVFFGIGWASSLNVPAVQMLLGTDYLSFMIPGVVTMTVFTSGLMSGASVIWDRQFGFLKEVLVAPASRLEAILGRMTGDTLVSLIQGCIMLGLGFLVAKGLSPAGVPVALLIMVLTALGFSAVGVALASLRHMKSFEGFFAMINMLMFPLIFASGAFFPLINLPSWFWIITYLDPLTYAVDSMRYFLAGVNYFDPLVDLAILVVFDLIAILIATKLFERVGLD